MKKVLCLLFSVFTILLITGCGSNSDNEIKKLNVDLEQYELPCVSGDVCNEIKGKIIQFSDYEAAVNFKNYDKIILTSDGSVYLYSAQNEELYKTNGKTELTKIEGVLPTSLNSSNSLLYENNKYYSIETNGNISEVSFDVNLKTIISYGENNIWGLDENRVLNHYVSCDYYKSYMGKQCSSGDNWIKIDDVSELNLKIKDFNLRTYITEDNKMYLRSLFNYNPLTNQARILDGSERDEKFIINDVSDSWYWNKSGDAYSGNLMVQTSDNKLHYKWASFTGNKFDSEIEFSEKVENTFFSGSSYYFLLTTKSNVFLLKKSGNNYETIELSEVSKYNNDIRSFYIKNGVAYALLSDGNLYKID